MTPDGEHTHTTAHTVEEQVAEAHSDKRTLRWLRALTFFMIGLACLFAAIVLYWILTPTPFNPMVFSTVQVQEVAPDGVVIVPQVRGVDAPSVFMDDPVPLVFSYCSDHDEDFAVESDAWFVNAATRERYPLLEDRLAVISPGCVSPRLSFDIPAHVADFVQAEVADAEGVRDRSSRWYIVGEVTPTRSGGVTAHWQTQTFLIVAERRPANE